MRIRPSVVAFDVVQTLMSLEPLRARLSEAGLPSLMLDHWFDRILRDGMALTLTGDYVPFPVVAAQSLRALAGRKLADDAVEHVMAGFAELPAQPDAEPAMRTLTDAGVSLICLSNGPAKSTMDFLRRSSLDSYVDQAISVEDVGLWKPGQGVYVHTLQCVGRTANQVALVAVHAWDCHGAARAGLTTGWASRLEQDFPPTFDRPDVVGDDLVEVAEGLLALPST